MDEQDGPQLKKIELLKLQTKLAFLESFPTELLDQQSASALRTITQRVQRFGKNAMDTYFLQQDTIEQRLINDAMRIRSRYQQQTVKNQIAYHRQTKLTEQDKNRGITQEAMKQILQNYLKMEQNKETAITFHHQDSNKNQLFIDLLQSPTENQQLIIKEQVVRQLDSFMQMDTQNYFKSIIDSAQEAWTDEQFEQFIEQSNQRIPNFGQIFQSLGFNTQEVFLHKNKLFIISMIQSFYGEAAQHQYNQNPQNADMQLDNSSAHPLEYIRGIYGDYNENSLEFPSIISQKTKLQNIESSNSLDFLDWAFSREIIAEKEWKESGFYVSEILIDRLLADVVVEQTQEIYENIDSRLDTLGAQAIEFFDTIISHEDINERDKNILVQDVQDLGRIFTEMKQNIRESSLKFAEKVNKQYEQERESIFKSSPNPVEALIKHKFTDIDIRSFNTVQKLEINPESIQKLNKIMDKMTGVSEFYKNNLRQGEKNQFAEDTFNLKKFIGDIQNKDYLDQNLIQGYRDNKLVSMLEELDLIDQVNPAIDPIFRVNKNLRDIVQTDSGGQRINNIYEIMRQYEDKDARIQILTQYLTMSNIVFKDEKQREMSSELYQMKNMMHGSLTELANDPLSASESIAVQMATRGVFPSMITDPDTIMTIQQIKKQIDEYFSQSQLVETRDLINLQEVPSIDVLKQFALAKGVKLQQQDLNMLSAIFTRQDAGDLNPQQIKILNILRSKDIFEGMNSEDLTQIAFSKTMHLHNDSHAVAYLNSLKKLQDIKSFTPKKYALYVSGAYVTIGALGYGLLGYTPLNADMIVAASSYIPGVSSILSSMNQQDKFFEMREAQLEKLYDNSIISPELYILDDQTGFTKDLNQILELDSFKQSELNKFLNRSNLYDHVSGSQIMGDDQSIPLPDTYINPYKLQSLSKQMSSREATFLQYNFGAENSLPENQYLNQLAWQEIQKDSMFENTNDGYIFLTSNDRIKKLAMQRFEGQQIVSGVKRLEDYEKHHYKQNDLEQIQLFEFQKAVEADTLHDLVQNEQLNLQLQRYTVDPSMQTQSQIKANQENFQRSKAEYDGLEIKSFDIQNIRGQTSYQNIIEFVSKQTFDLSASINVTVEMCDALDATITNKYDQYTAQTNQQVLRIMANDLVFGTAQGYKTCMQYLGNAIVEGNQMDQILLEIDKSEDGMLQEIQRSLGFENLGDKFSVISIHRQIQNGMRNSYNKMLQQFESVTKFEYGKSANDFFQVAINENSKIVEEVGEIGIKAIDFYNRLDLTLMSITDYPVINNHLNPDQQSPLVMPTESAQLYMNYLRESFYYDTKGVMEEQKQQNDRERLEEHWTQQVYNRGNQYISSIEQQNTFSKVKVPIVLDDFNRFISMDSAQNIFDQKKDFHDVQTIANNMTKILSMQSLNQPEKFSLNMAIDNFESLESMRIFLGSTQQNLSEVRGMSQIVDQTINVIENLQTRYPLEPSNYFYQLFQKSQPQEDIMRNIFDEMNKIILTAIEGEYDSYIDNFPRRLIQGQLNYVSKDYRNELINNFNTLSRDLQKTYSMTQNTFKQVKQIENGLQSTMNSLTQLSGAQQILYKDVNKYTGFKTYKEYVQQQFNGYQKQQDKIENDTFFSRISLLGLLMSGVTMLSMVTNCTVYSYKYYKQN